MTPASVGVEAPVEEGVEIAGPEEMLGWYTLVVKVRVGGRNGYCGGRLRSRLNVPPWWEWSDVNRNVYWRDGIALEASLAREDAI